ncbi:MAG: hypothetical protein ACRBN8_19145 [Nannocystales bacterium]
MSEIVLFRSSLCVGEDIGDVCEDNTGGSVAQLLAAPSCGAMAASPSVATIDCGVLGSAIGRRLSYPATEQSLIDL